jgi:internalin A
MPAGPVPHPWLRSLRYSVRGLIVLVLVIGTGLGWIVHQANVQRDAVAAIERTGANVLYSWDFEEGNRIPGGTPWAPQWFADLIGVDYFGHVTFVGLPIPMYPPATDATLAEVGRLTRLQVLSADSTSLSDAGLAHLKGLAKLSRLELNGTRITDAGLAHLKGLTNLSHLGLSGTKVSDAGLAHLKGLTKLIYLELVGTEVTDAGLRELKKALADLEVAR